MKKLKLRAVSFLLLLVALVCMLTACSGSGSVVNTTVTINEDLSGSRTMVVQLDDSNFSSYFSGTIDDLKNVIINHCPEELSYSFEEGDVNSVTFTLSFGSVEDYSGKVASILGEEPQIEISVPESLWANGIYVSESFTSRELLAWLSNVLVEEGYVDSSYQSSIFSAGDTFVAYNGQSESTYEEIYLDRIEYLSISGIDVLTDIESIDSYKRTVVFHVPSESVSLKGSEIDSYMAGIVPQGASYESEETSDGIDYTYSSEGLSLQELDAFDAALFGNGSFVTDVDVEGYYSAFSFSRYMDEEIDLSNFLDGGASVYVSFYVGVSDEFNVCQTSDPEYVYDASSNYWVSDEYENYYQVLTRTCYSGETCSVPMLYQKNFTISSMDVASSHSMNGKKWTRTSTFYFAEAPDEDEDSMIVARLNAIVGNDEDSDPEDTEDPAEAVTDGTEAAENTEETSSGKVKIESKTKDGVYQISIKQTGTSADIQESSLLLFGSSGSQSYISESGPLQITKTEAFAEQIDYSGLLAETSDDFMIHYSMKLGLSPKMEYCDTYGTDGVVDGGKLTSDTYSTYVDVTYFGTALDIFSLLFWIVIAAAVVLMIFAIVKSGLLKALKKPGQQPQYGQPMQYAQSPQGGQPMQYTQQPQSEQPLQNTQPAAMFCNVCGAKLAPGSRFCESCGNKIEQ